MCPMAALFICMDLAAMQPDKKIMHEKSVGLSSTSNPNLRETIPLTAQANLI